MSDSYNKKPTLWVTALIFLLATLLIRTSEGLAFANVPQSSNDSSTTRRTPSTKNKPPSSLASSSSMSTRRNILKNISLFTTVSVVTTTIATSAFPSPASARYIMNEEGEYIELAEEDWQTAWKQRLDKASSMSQEDIFNAARGAGNLDLKEGMEESDASRKRRAMSACRNDDLRKKVGGGSLDLKACNMKVMGGETDFILNP